MKKSQRTDGLYYRVVSAIKGYFSYVKGRILDDFVYISPTQAYALLKNDENITLLDVRVPEKFAQEYVEGAILIPLQVLYENISMLQNVKGEKIIVYCHNGRKSIAASRILVKNGFIPLNVKGGIIRWKKEGLSVIQN